MATIAYGELPYLEVVPSDGRSFVVHPYTDAAGKSWLYLEHDSQLLVIEPVRHHEGPFIAEVASDLGLDLHMPLSECVARYFSFPATFNACASAEADLRNSLATLHKYFILLKHAQADRSVRSSVVVMTEAEYAFSNHRALYDRLNEVVRQLWRTLRRFRDGSDPRPLPELPDSFHRVAQKGVDELRTKYNFPEALANFYSGRLDAFMILREIRDAIVHHGKSLDHVFVCDDGFAVGVDRGITARLATLAIWDPSTLKPNGLGSLLSVFVHLVEDGFSACAALAAALHTGIRLPVPLLKPTFHTFYRSQLAPHYHSIDSYKRQPWQDPTVVLAGFNEE